MKKILHKIKKLLRWCFATLPRRIVSTLIIIALVVAPVYTIFFAREAKAAWWNDSWQYRQKIQLTNSTGADLTDFQVSTTVDTASLITAGKMIASTCADMRFTDSKGQPLDYWIEENNPGCNNAATKVWVKAPKVYSGTNATSIYMYYGNPSATTSQSGDKTFQFFDDFDGGTINSAKWTQEIKGVGGTISETGGAAILSPTASTISSANLKSIPTFTNNYVFEIRRKQASNERFMHFSLGSGSVVSVCHDTNYWHTAIDNGYDWFFHISGGSDDGLYKVPGSGCYTSITNSAITLDTSTYKVHKFSYGSAGAISWAIDGSVQYSGSDSTYLSNSKNILISQGENTFGYGADQSIDYLFTRKYASTDPTTSASAEEVGPGPVAYWRFDEGQGSTAYNSTSQTGINGTLQNSPTWKPESDCVGGKCLEYNGTTQYVSVDDTGTALDFDAAKPYTWSTWINYSGFPAGQTKQCFLSKDPPISTKPLGFNLCLNQTGSTADVVICKGDVACSSEGSLNLSANTWNHLEITYDGSSNWKVYKDGVDKGSQSYSVSSDTAAKYYIGAGTGSSPGGAQVPGYFFKGKIDSVKIFPYQRSADQVKQDYNSGKSGADTSEGTEWSVGKSPQWMTNGLVGHWKMDESSGTAVADASGNANTGTLTNAQETGTSDASGNSVTTMVDTDGSLSTTNDAYNNMILRFTAACGSIASGTERTITDYTGTPHTFTVATLAQAPDSCAYEIRHQTGGKFGNGVGFGGDPYDTTNDYVDAGDKTAFNSNTLSISFWMKTAAAGGASGQGILSKGTTPGSSGRGYYLNMLLGQIKWSLADSSNNWHTISSGGSYSDNNWHFVTATVDTTGMKLYVDGALKNSDPQNSFSYSSGYNLFIGKINGSSGNGNGFFGLLDDVRIYNRAFSPDEVKQLSEYGPGPVGWWKMDENVSGNGQTIKDWSGNGNNGTTNDGANNTGMDCTKNGKYGGACENDGVDDKITSSSSAFNMQYAVTQEAWIKPNSAALSSGITMAGGCLMRVDQGSSNLFQPQCRIGGGYRIPSGTKTLTNNEWQHVALTYDMYSRQILFYVNGILLGNSTLSGLSNYDIDNTIFGNLQVGGSGFSSTYFHGLIDDVRIYNYARTSKQVVEDMNAGHPAPGSPVGSPVAYWKMDEGYGGTSQDSSQNNQDLTLVNSPAWTNSGKFGRALDFERDSSQYGWTADSPALSITSDLTVSAWIKPESNSAGTDYIIAAKWASSNQSYSFQQYGSELRMSIDSGSNFKQTSGLGLQVGQWYYVSGVYNAVAQTVTIYVNGVDKGGSVGGTIPSSIGDDASSFFVGYYSGAGTVRYFDGLIDEVKVYNSALTPEQIALDMNQGKSMQLGGQVSATGATGQAAEYCVPGDSTSCAGPVAEWKFDEKTGGSANDTSGNGNVGTWYGTGTHWDRGKIGSAGKFNYPSSNDYAKITSLNGTSFYQKGTLSFWFNIKDNAGWSNYNGLFHTRDTNGLADWFGIDKSGTSNPSALRVEFGNSGGSITTTYTNNTFDSSSGWKYLTVTWDQTANQRSIYVNGILDNTTSVSTWPSIFQNIVIGNDRGMTARSFNGLIDGMVLYNYARTPAQIAWDVNRGKPVGWWKLDEGEGGYAYDSSGFGNTGTLTTMDPPNDWVDGKFGKALDFDGTNDYISAGTAPSFDSTKQYSWSAWIKWTSFAESTQCYFSKDITFPKTSGYNLCLNQTSSTADPIICKGDTLGSMACSSGLNLNLPSDSWINLSVVYDGAGNWQIYKNGQYMGAETLSVFSDTTAKYFIGAGNGLQNGGNQVPDYFFTGQIDDVRVFNYALTAEQIKQVMNEGSAVRFGDQ